MSAKTQKKKRQKNEHMHHGQRAACSYAPTSGTVTVSVKSYCLLRVQGHGPRLRNLLPATFCCGSNHSPAWRKLLAATYDVVQTKVRDREHCLLLLWFKTTIRHRETDMKKEGNTARATAET